MKLYTEICLLSLGQQQRINFARVLLRPSISFALMDECTSACDPANEFHLYRLLQAHLRGYVSVGHRPSLQDFHNTLANTLLGDIPDIKLLEDIPGRHT
eukprot:s3840_g6.t1